MLAEENRHGGWPKNGEIDFMEHVGYDPGRIHGTVHTEAFNHSIGTHKGGQRMVSDFHQEFHTYAIDWTKEKIDFYIDGAKYFTFKTLREITKNGLLTSPFIWLYFVFQWSDSLSRTRFGRMP
jgi:beta-glucanase (GH16 family)